MVFIADSDNLTAQTSHYVFLAAICNAGIGLVLSKPGIKSP
jgi:hypothetical protein